MRKRKGIIIMARLIRLIQPMLPFMAAAVAAGTAGFLSAIFLTLAGVYAILSAAGIYDCGVTVSRLLVMIGVLAVSRGILRYAEQACNHYIAFRVLARIRSAVFAALRRLAPAKLECRGKGDLIALITSDVELLEVFYAHTISPVCIAVAVCAVLLRYLGAIHGSLAAIAFAAYLLVGVGIPLLNSRLTKDAGMAHRRAFGQLSGFVLDSLRGLSELLRFGSGGKRLRELDGKTGELHRLQRKLKRQEGLTRALTDTVILAADAATLFVAVRLYGAGAIEIQGVFLATVAVMSGFGAVTALSALSNTLALTLSGGDRILDVLDETPETEEVTDGEVVAFEGASAEDVCFAYDHTPVLRGFHAEIPKGKIIGITGRSGAGKSTVLKLLMRFWDVDGGEIRVSGKDVRGINTKALRDLYGYVTQETALFHESIMENIRIAKTDATEEEVVAAAKKASLHAFASALPNGYDTNVGELGDRLSGGERQRIGVARAFLSGAPLILLDEPTSNLDSLNEGVILKAVRDARRDRTVVLVSHRQSTMRIADDVIDVPMLE
ncbi:MAG: thiol reductant ABC exporter subunit CydC [Clostridiales bacterium]|jgi:ATP-binding cassette subfamily C protein|nr:thiol reductant ABC exporter subunit CydC [Clostridiales bacterium]